VPGRLYPVGRLDWDSEGLVLMTNDGELTNRLTHPRYGHEKEYRVLVARRPDAEQLNTWRRGVVLEDGYRTAAAKVMPDGEAGKGAWLRVTMGEGRRRQIREVGAQLGLPVVRIVRVRVGTLNVGRLKPGDWRYLTDREIGELKGKTSGVAPRARTRSGIHAERRPPKSKPRSGPAPKRGGHAEGRPQKPNPRAGPAPRGGGHAERRSQKPNWRSEDRPRGGGKRGKRTR